MNRPVIDRLIVCPNRSVHEQVPTCTTAQWKQGIHSRTEKSIYGRTNRLHKKGFPKPNDRAKDQTQP
jgi:hypothetical protein